MSSTVCVIQSTLKTNISIELGDWPTNRPHSFFYFWLLFPKQWTILPSSDFNEQQHSFKWAKEQWASDSRMFFFHCLHLESRFLLVLKENRRFSIYRERATYLLSELYGFSALHGNVNNCVYVTQFISSVHCTFDVIKNTN